MNELHTVFCTNFRPDLIDMEMVSQQSNQENLEQAFEIAESLGVTRLLDAEGKTFKRNTAMDLFIIRQCPMIRNKNLSRKKYQIFSL